MTISEVLANPRNLTYQQSCGRLSTAIEGTVNVFKRLDALRLFYKENEDLILESGSFNWAFSYPIDWSLLLNPIEMQAWCVIRSIGRVVLYPQFPVGKYVLDFGNPCNRIGLEIDGKQFHNGVRDQKRDEELAKLGWVIYRITGKEMYFVDTEFYDLDEQDQMDPENPIVKHHILNTGEGVIKSILYLHFLDGAEDWPLNGLMENSLFTHKLVK